MPKIFQGAAYAELAPSSPSDNILDEEAIFTWGFETSSFCRGKSGAIVSAQSMVTNRRIRC